jgi:hypothetical protein
MDHGVIWENKTIIYSNKFFELSIKFGFAPLCGMHHIIGNRDRSIFEVSIRDFTGTLWFSTRSIDWDNIDCSHEEWMTCKNPPNFFSIFFNSILFITMKKWSVSLQFNLTKMLTQLHLTLIVF